MFVLLPGGCGSESMESAKARVSKLSLIEGDLSLEARDVGCVSS